MFGNAQSFIGVLPVTAWISILLTTGVVNNDLPLFSEYILKKCHLAFVHAETYLTCFSPSLTVLQQLPLIYPHEFGFSSQRRTKCHLHITFSL